MIRDPYPLFLLLSGRLVVVAGGGEIAERKIAGLVAAGAHVRVVAPTMSTVIRDLGARTEVELCERSFEDADLDGAWFAIACTDDEAAQAQVASGCERRRLFCLAVDDVARATAVGGAEIRRPPFLIAISTGGAAPALARLVREIIEQVLPDSDWVDQATALRARWKRENVPMSSRFPELVRVLAERAGYLGKPK